MMQGGYSFEPEVAGWEVRSRAALQFGTLQGLLETLVANEPTLLRPLEFAQLGQAEGLREESERATTDLAG